ncbi:hypothetical protein B0H13DRAFT_2375683 [Mycena leptocephala]|nr:hypothetical protein B0H13DRAFT_2375683 [Mycena leptocephala]
MARKRRQPQNEEITEKCHRSTSTKVSAEDKKKRQREWYAKNAVRIREKSRVQVAEKRAAIKAKRRKSDKPRTSQRKLTSDELIASVALTQMREQQELPAVRRGMVPQTDNTVDAPQPVASDFPTYVLFAVKTEQALKRCNKQCCSSYKCRAAVDKEIEDLLEQGAEAPPLESESSSEDEDLDIGVGGVSATSGGEICIEGLSSILISAHNSGSARKNSGPRGGADCGCPLQRQSALVLNQRDGYRASTKNYGERWKKGGQYIKLGVRWNQARLRDDFKLLY